MLKRFIIKNIWMIVLFISIILLVIHTFNLFSLNVDSTSIVLLILILISPFITSIKKLKYGEFEAEINSEEIQKIKNEVETIIEDKIDSENISLIYKEIESIIELSNSDKIMALAKIRIELEKLLIRFYSSITLDAKRLPLSKHVVELVNLGAISKKIGKSLNEVISICNRAIHGEYINENDSDIIITLGIDLIEEIHWLIKEQSSTGTIISEEIISDNQVEYFRDEIFYEITTIIPLVKNPKKITRKMTQNQFEDLLENYQEYAEFVVSVKELKN